MSRCAPPVLAAALGRGLQRRDLAAPLRVLSAVAVMANTEVFGDLHRCASPGFTCAPRGFGDTQELLLAAIEGHIVRDQGFLKATKGFRHLRRATKISSVNLQG